MPPKLKSRKSAGRKNQAQDARTTAERQTDVTRGILIASGRLNLTNVRRGWVVLQCAIRFALVFAKVQRQRGHDTLIHSITNADGKLPSVYKARQFGASHHAFNSADQREVYQSPACIYKNRQHLHVRRVARPGLVVVVDLHICLLRGVAEGRAVTVPLEPP